MSLPSEGVAGSNTERTFIAIKPDGVQRGLIGNIIGRFETKGFKLVAMKVMTPTLAQAQGHYADLSSKKFFGGLCSYFSSGPICAMVWEGQNAIKTGRTLLGATNPADSLPGTIRGDLCIDVGRNICHGSDGPDSAKHEINFWFTPSELNNYTSTAESWIYEDCTPPKVAATASPSDRVFPVHETDGRAAIGGLRYKTHDNDVCLGAKAPAFGNTKSLQVDAWSDKTLPEAGQAYVVIFWAQFHKPGYKFLELYNKLALKYGSTVKFVANAMDPEALNAIKFMEDPGKKYSTVFPCDALTMSFSAKGKGILENLTEAYGVALMDTLSPVHSFVVDKTGTIVWHQDHSEIGATAPQYMGLMETQIDHMVAGTPLEKVGEKAVDDTADEVEAVKGDISSLSMLTGDGDDY